MKNIWINKKLKLKKGLFVISMLGSSAFISGCGINKITDKPQYVEVIVTEITEDDKVNTSNIQESASGDTNLENEEKIEETDIVKTETSVESILKEFAFTDREAIIEGLYGEEILDEEVKNDMIADTISNYVIALQEINKINPLKDVNMTDYFNENYESILYGENVFAADKTAYSALAYQKLVDNEVDIIKAFDELNSMMVLQTYPTDLDENYYNETFKVLLSTLKKEENLYDIYFPLAEQLHFITCGHEHTKEYGITSCDDLEKQYHGL